MTARDLFTVGLAAVRWKELRFKSKSPVDPHPAAQFQQSRSSQFIYIELKSWAKSSSALLFSRFSLYGSSSLPPSRCTPRAEAKKPSAEREPATPEPAAQPEPAVSAAAAAGPAKETMAATKKRAAAGMLRAFRGGELEAIADDLEKMQEAEQSTYDSHLWLH